MARGKATVACKIGYGNHLICRVVSTISSVDPYAIVLRERSTFSMTGYSFMIEFLGNKIEGAVKHKSALA